MRQLKLIIAALFVFGPMSAQAVPIVITGTGATDGVWDVTLIEGTWADRIGTLSLQVWFDDPALALVFADTVGDLLGFPLEPFGLGPSFAVNPGLFDDCCADVWAAIFNPDEGAIFWTSDSDDLYTVSWAVATRVPEPGTLALLGIGLLGMGLMRRRTKV